MTTSEPTVWKKIYSKPQEKETKTANDKEQHSFGTYSFGVPTKIYDQDNDEIQIPCAQRTISFGKEKNTTPIASSPVVRQTQRTMAKQRQGSFKNRQLEARNKKLNDYYLRINDFVESIKKQKRYAQQMELKYNNIGFGSIQLDMSINLREHYKQCLQISKGSKLQQNTKQQFQKRTELLHNCIRKMIQDFKISNRSKDKQKNMIKIIQGKNQAKMLKYVNSNKVKIAFLRQQIQNLINIINEGSLLVSNQMIMSSKVT